MYRSPFDQCATAIGRSYSATRVPFWSGRQPLNRLTGTTAILCCLLLASAGCSSSSQGTPRRQSDKQTAEKAQANGNAPRKTKKTKPKTPDPTALWAKRIETIGTHLEKDRLQKAEELLDTVEQDGGLPAEELTDDQRSQLSTLEERLAKKQRARADDFREEKLAEGRDLLKQGDLEAAQQAAGAVLARAPTDEQRQAATSLKDQIEQRRRARRELGAYLRLLGSENPSEVRAAQSQLARKVQTALPLLLESVRQADKPVLVANTLELLRRLNRADVALPAMIGVLKRPEQKANWPDAVEQIRRMRRPGAGRPLLDLVLQSDSAEQRKAALTALAEVVDPPADTLSALLPWLHQDGPELAAALRATFNAMQVHGQFDLWARRAIGEPLSGEKAKQLADLPQRLAEIAQRGSDKESPSSSEAADAAQRLAVAIRHIPPQPLQNVKLASVTSETEESPAAALLDGTWSSTELKTMWRYPINQDGTVVLDLGRERTVAGVRLWNYNEENHTDRGWKEVAVYVSNTKSALEPVATGIVPRAPGAAETPDYSTLIPVDFARGRYVKLKAESLWNRDDYSGLSEVKVLGF